MIRNFGIQMLGGLPNGFLPPLLPFTQFELATNEFPYERWGNPFAQLRQVVKEPSPELPKGRYSPVLEDFINQW